MPVVLRTRMKSLINVGQKIAEAAIYHIRVFVFVWMFRPLPKHLVSFLRYVPHSAKHSVMISILETCSPNETDGTYSVVQKAIEVHTGCFHCFEMHRNLYSLV